MDQFRPSKLWKQVPPDRRLEAARAFWEDEHSGDQQAEALAAIAQQMKFRPKSAAALPVEKRARYLVGVPAVSDLLASRLLVAYHLASHRPMLGRFLDALGITHEHGLIADEHVARPDKARLAGAAQQLRAEFPEADVDLYFATLVAQDPEVWGDLAEFVSAGSH
ncbi:MAG TPA: hypothetical protein VK886_02970 [Vicinamibacterales bacterium]|nr:hypothetical protein [Vicinamibacterales bacterium]